MALLINCMRCEMRRRNNTIIEKKLFLNYFNLLYIFDCSSPLNYSFSVAATIANGIIYFLFVNNIFRKNRINKCLPAAYTKTSPQSLAIWFSVGDCHNGLTVPGVDESCEIQLRMRLCIATITIARDGAMCTPSNEASECESESERQRNRTNKETKKRREKSHRHINSYFSALIVACYALLKYFFFHFRQIRLATGAVRIRKHSLYVIAVFIHQLVFVLSVWHIFLAMCEKKNGLVLIRPSNFCWCFLSFSFSQFSE